MNYFELILGGIIGYVIGKFGDYLRQNALKAIRLKDTKKRLKKVENIKYPNILPLDHADHSYEPIDIQISLTPKNFYFSIPAEFRDRIINLFGSKVFKFRDVGHNDFSFDRINYFFDTVKKHKASVAQKFIDTQKEARPLFNSQKLGVFDIRIKRHSITQNGILEIKLFRTDYFTHMVCRSIYRELNSLSSFSEKLDLDFFHQNFKDFSFLNTSFGLYIFVQVNEGFVLCRRSSLVSNSEEAGKWHVSVDEGLDIQDLKNGKVDIVNYAHRGLAEELGLSHSVLEKYQDSKIRFIDVFLEKKRYELVMSAYIKLNMPYKLFLEFYNTAKDGEYETSGITCLPNHYPLIKRFYRDEPMTDMAKYCLDRILARGIV